MSRPDTPTGFPEAHIVSLRYTIVWVEDTHCGDEESFCGYIHIASDSKPSKSSCNTRDASPVENPDMPTSVEETNPTTAPTASSTAPTDAPNDDVPEEPNNIPCTATLAYGCFLAQFTTELDPLCDIFTNFELQCMNHDMARDMDDIPKLLWVGHYDNTTGELKKEFGGEGDMGGQELLQVVLDTGYSGCVEGVVRLWAKKWNPGKERPRLTREERRVLRIRGGSDDGMDEEEEGDDDEGGDGKEGSEGAMGEVAGAMDVTT